MINILNDIFLFQPLIMLFLALLLVKLFSFDSRRTFFTSSLILFIFNIVSLYIFDISASLNIYIPLYDFSISLSLLSSGVEALFYLTSNLLLIISFLDNKNIEKTLSFFSLTFITHIFLNFVFISKNLMSFYLSLEMSYLCVFLMFSVSILDKKKTREILSFFSLQAFSSGLFLAALIFLSVKGYLHNNDATISAESIRSMTDWPMININERSLIFWTFLLSILIKIGQFPFHLNLLDLSRNIDRGVMGFYLGIVSKGAIFGMMFFILPGFYNEVEKFRNILLILMSFSSLYYFSNAIYEKENKRKLTYLANGQISLILLGLFSGEVFYLQNAIELILIQALSISLLFFILNDNSKSYFNRPLTMFLIFTNAFLPMTPGFPRFYAILVNVLEVNFIAGSMTFLSLGLATLAFWRIYQTNISLPDMGDSQIWNRNRAIISLFSIFLLLLNFIVLV